MARSLFGGSVGDQVLGRVPVGGRMIYGPLVDDTGSQFAATLTVWTALAGGSQITDLTEADGLTPITSFVTSVGTGYVRAFCGPDGVTSVYVSPDAGVTRYRFAVGPVGPPGDITAAGVETLVSQFDVTGKTSAQVNAWLATSTKHKRMVGTHAITATLLLNNTDTHLDASGAVLTCATDITSLRCVGGQSQQIHNLKISNTTTGVRTTYDIELVNPTNQGLFNVEVNLPNGSLTKGGIRIYKDIAQAGSNYFMPRLERVWIRNGHLVIDGCTDGKVTDSWIWAPFTGASAAISVTNSSSNWTFDSVDVVPPQGDAYGYYLDTVENVHINGGLLDGSGAGILTGWGIKAVNCYRLSVKTSFWNLGRGAIWLSGVKASTFIGNVISRCNKADNSWPDIQVDDSRYNAFVANTHSAIVARTNKGQIYVESGTSTDNIIDENTMESNEGVHYYHATLVTFLASTRLGINNRPLSAWPRSLARTVTATETVPGENITRGYTLFASNTITLTLPTAGAFFVGTSIPIKNIGTGVVTIDANGSETIDGALTLALEPGQSVLLTTSASTAWRIVSISPSITPSVVAPQGCLVSVPAATAWPAASTAIFHRFTVPVGGFYRYVNFRLDVTSGNYQVAVVRLSGAGLTSYTRVMDTAVVATPAIGDKTTDLGSTYLTAGEYAIAFWFDNTTAQVRYATNSGMTASRLTAEVASLATGVPSSGSLTWGSAKYVGGATVGAA